MYLNINGKRFKLQEMAYTQVSIIIPTLNHAKYLKNALTSVQNQTFPKDEYEIIVVDNGSTDNTQQVTEQIIATYQTHQIRYIWEPEPGLLSGRHRGAKEAKGQILVFIDDDIEADKGWLAAIMDAFQDPSVHLVGGPSQPDYKSEPPAWLESFWEQHEYGRLCGWLSLLDFGEQIREIDPIFIWGLNYAIRKKTLFEVGGFHPDCIPKHLQRFQGDGEIGLSTKIRETGLKAVYHPKALVWHKVLNERLTVEYFEKRAFYQGVCSSYTQIRMNYQGGLQFKKQSKLIRLLSWRTPFKIYNLLRERIRQKYSGYAEIKKRTDEAYQAGFAFHQNEVANDPELLKWVLKENYFDYRLPGQSAFNGKIDGGTT
jgi:glycosyltransferase involved in cell wall biosynthesis